MTACPFDRVLVANRGEIAVRVLRGVHELGATAITIYSEADADALHVREADVAELIGPAEPAHSYLDIDRVLGAARATGAQAIHPGYGFLSENAEFARACEREGITFIGPTGEAMEALGSKRLAKEAAAAAKVPCVPGFDGHEASDETMRSEAERIGFPLLVKASAGGGGRGMRLVRAAEEFDEALAAGRREAVQAFGNGSMLLEKYIRPARHVEVQVLGDGQGHAVALGERECSIQRRHQKVLEEAPSPIVDAALRERLEQAAVRLAEATHYRNAGTVEFLVDEAGAFYFLEVNTRLQVEHPVTELVTGLDLVHLQIAIAAGMPLASLLSGHKRTLRGHALEARICAEDPSQGFLPASGRLEICRLAEGPGIRIDSGFDEGTEVSVHYDSLLAKVIVQAPNRRACIVRMRDALMRSAWLGIPTNVDFLLRVLEHPEFIAGNLRTDFLDVHGELTQFEDETPPESVLFAAALAPAFARSSTASPCADTQSTASPWAIADGFRLGTNSLGTAE